ncbi:MAG: hypothetical protein IT355_20625 [Gemmatimonadaceae bacterium]|nr:hypothetical protein [Gemmatimonadaceae bacterium]
MVMLPATHAEATHVIEWALEQVSTQLPRRVPVPALLEAWFDDAQERWPAAWRAAQRSPAALLWLASRCAALRNFEDDELALFETRTAVRSTAPGMLDAIAELLAVGDVLRHLGVIPDRAGDPLPPLLASYQERARRLPACALPNTQSATTRGRRSGF